MKHLATPYTLSLRRARFLQTVLFGAFVYCYVAILQYERIYPLLTSLFPTLSPAHPHHTLITLTPLVVGTIAALIGMAAYSLATHHVWLPVRIGGKRRLAGCILAAFTLCLITSPSETDTLTRKTRRLNTWGEYRQSVEVSSRFIHPTKDLLLQRAIALSRLGCLGEEFFTYPLADVGEELARELPDNDSFDLRALRHLLLGDLRGFVKVCEGIPHAQLQRAEREALVLYMHTHSSPMSILIQDPNIEANYRDYLDYEHRLLLSARHYTLSERSSLMADSYGDTYWYYYSYVRTP